jgi:hypothetical protein
MKCSKCGREFDQYGKDGERVPTIYGDAQGYECSDSYYFCRRCEVYTVKTVHESFPSGDLDTTTRGPVSKEQGDAKVALIRRCPTPTDKWCHCEAHRAIFP